MKRFALYNDGVLIETADDPQTIAELFADARARPHYLILKDGGHAIAKAPGSGHIDISPEGRAATIQNVLRLIEER